MILSSNEYHQRLLLFFDFFEELRRSLNFDIGVFSFDSLVNNEDSSYIFIFHSHFIIKCRNRVLLIVVNGPLSRYVIVANKIVAFHI